MKGTLTIPETFQGTFIGYCGSSDTPSAFNEKKKHRVND